MQLAMRLSWLAKRMLVSFAWPCLALGCSIEIASDLRMGVCMGCGPSFQTSSFELVRQDAALGVPRDALINDQLGIEIFEGAKTALSPVFAVRPV